MSIQQPSDLQLSFEFFPAVSDVAQRRMWRAIGQLELLEPAFFSMTYGALGSARERSLEALEQLQQGSAVETAAHLTCVDASRDEINQVVEKIRALGVRRFVALRGDPQGDSANFAPAPDAYQSAVELVEGLRAIDEDFDISVAAYPEVHPQALSAKHDLQNLKNKLDAGANRGITQYFFDTEQFLRFRDEAAAIGIDKPIVPGILPVHDIDRVVNFSQRCGANVPDWLKKRFSVYAGDKEAQYHLAIDLAVSLCHELADEGVDSFHFYTLNLTDICYAVARELGIHAAKKPTLAFRKSA